MCLQKACIYGAHKRVNGRAHNVHVHLRAAVSSLMADACALVKTRQATYETSKMGGAMLTGANKSVSDGSW